MTGYLLLPTKFQKHGPSMEKLPELGAGSALQDDTPAAMLLIELYLCTQ